MIRTRGFWISRIWDEEGVEEAGGGGVMGISVSGLCALVARAMRLLLGLRITVSMSMIWKLSALSCGFRHIMMMLMRFALAIR